jgi:hypothetical protein
LNPSRLPKLPPHLPACIGNAAHGSRANRQDEHVTWLPATFSDMAARGAYQDTADLAEWSSWLPFEDARRAAPREPGVYLMREPTGEIRYAGMAGERAASGRPEGLHGRLSAYLSGKGAVSGFGEAALDRALADPDWVEQQLRRLRARGPKRAKEWAREAVQRLGLEVSWAVCANKDDARFLESRVVALLRPHGLWNK